MRARRVTAVIGLFFVSILGAASPASAITTPTPRVSPTAVPPTDSPTGTATRTRIPSSPTPLSTLTSTRRPNTATPTEQLAETNTPRPTTDVLATASAIAASATEEPTAE